MKEEGRPRTGTRAAGHRQSRARSPPRSGGFGLQRKEKSPSGYGLAAGVHVVFVELRTRRLTTAALSSDAMVSVLDRVVFQLALPHHRHCLQCLLRCRPRHCPPRHCPQTLYPSTRRCRTPGIALVSGHFAAAAAEEQHPVSPKLPPPLLRPRSSTHPTQSPGMTPCQPASLPQVSPSKAFCPQGTGRSDAVQKSVAREMVAVKALEVLRCWRRRKKRP